jgi:hypothetical protein
MKAKKTYSIDSRLAKKVKVVAFEKEITASSIVEAALEVYLQKLQKSNEQVTC